MPVVRSRAAIVLFVAAAVFVDLLAYSAAVPVLPHLATTLGASPTTIGFLFGSFGITLLAVSIPMGVASDRIGRKWPLVGGMLALALGTSLFGVATSLPGLLAARLLQGAADGVTWAVGFALIADVYGPSERGRVMGVVMSSAGVGVMIGPPFGGWLYQLGGVALPFLVIAAASLVLAALFLSLEEPTHASDERPASFREVLRVRGLVIGAAVGVAASGTIGMLEAVLPLEWSRRLRFGPAEIGMLFGLAALVSAVLHPFYGHLSDRWGARRLMLLGLLLTASLLPIFTLVARPLSVAIAIVLVWAAIGLTTTPSLALMASAASSAGIASFGVVYGFYNVAWGVGLLGGPSVGGFLLERLGLALLAAAWIPVLLLIALGVAVNAPKATPAPSIPGR